MAKQIPSSNNFAKNQPGLLVGGQVIPLQYIDTSGASNGDVLTYVSADGQVEFAAGGGGGGITALTGDVTASGSGSVVATIANLAVTDAKVSASAAIAFSKLATLTSAHILVGSAGNVATSVAVSGNASISNTGAVSVTGLTIASQATGDILYFDGTNWIRLPIGTAGQTLTVNGGGTAPVWA